VEVVDDAGPVETEVVSDDVVEDGVEELELLVVEVGRAVRSRARSWECGTGVWRSVPSE